MTVSLRQLELLRLMMRTRSVTETARLMRISQPSASQMLRSLETQLGLELFARVGGRLRPTAEALGLLPVVERLFSHYALLDGRAAELRDAQAGNLTIASIPTVTGWLLPEAMARFHQERPRVHFLINARDAADVVRAVRQEDADLGILYSPIEDAAVAVEPLFRTRMVCVIPPGHALAQKKTVRAKDLADHRIVTLDSSLSPGLALAESLRGSHVRFEPNFETNMSFTAISLVNRGLGVFVTDPLICLSPLGSALTVRDFAPEIPLTLTVIYSRHRAVPRIAVRFVARLREAIGFMCEGLAQRGLPGQAV
jgi:DNA-binding transcriptional LysR family regulator